MAKKSDARLISNILLLIFASLMFFTLLTPIVQIKCKNSTTISETGVDSLEALFTTTNDSGIKFENGDAILNIMQEKTANDVKTNTTILLVSYIVTLLCTAFVIVCLIMRMIKVHVSLIHFISSTAFFISTIITFVFSIIVANAQNASSLGKFALILLNSKSSIGFGSILLLISGLSYALTYIGFKNAK